MKKIFLSLLFFSTILFGLEVDVKTLQQIINDDPKALKERIILAKYYLQQNNDLKAELLLNEALQIDPKNTSAKRLRSIIQRKRHNKEIFQEAQLQQPIDKEEAQKRLQSYYDANNYQFYSNLYQALMDNGITLDDPYHVKAAYIYLWDARYKQAQKALKHIKLPNNIDKAKIQADICYYQGDYKCAKRLYEKLYNSSYELDYAIKLLYSYIYLGENEKAQRLYNFLKRKHYHSKELDKIGSKLTQIRNSYIENVKKAYEDDPNDTTLEAYASALNTLGKTKELLALLKEHNTKNATPKSLLLEAKYLTWNDHSNEALEILKSKLLHNDLEAKLLLGKIYSWNQDFSHAKENLDSVIQNGTDEALLYEAKKAKAFVYLWEKEQQKAKQLFNELLKQNPHDKEIQEALMELNHNYKELIKVYEKKVASNPNPNDLKRLSELYLLTKQPTKATKILDRYLKQNPNDLDALHTYALLLIEKKDYYKGFGYLEYYTAQKQTPQSSIELAKYYYWNGFSKEALDVLDNLLQKDPQNKEALELKATILKISPRFTTSNSGATIGMYYDELGKKQLQLADALYFNGHYEASLMYYENYLKNNPTDHTARLRYAFALENAKWYAKAEGEFALMLWTQDTDEIRYHYAYNMMKNGKYKEAKKEFLRLKQATFHTITPKLKNFLDQWEKAWESQDYARYASFYAPNFTQDQQWAFRKQQIFSSVNFISVAIYDPVYKKLPNGNYLVRFYQEYATNKKSDSGYKTLQLKCQKDQTECQIVKESWKAGKYKKQNLLAPYIDNALKELERLQNAPLSSTTSKHSRYYAQSKKKILQQSLKLKNITIST